MKLTVLLGAAALVLAAGSANAAVDVFHLTGSSALYGVVDATFELDSSPTLDQSLVLNDSFRINDVAISYNGGTPIGGHQVAFFLGGEFGGGLEFTPPGGGPPPADTWSPGGEQLFTGDKHTPQFKLGTYSLTDYWNPSMSYTLTITQADAPAAPVPEPAGWAMLIAGFALTGGALRRSRATAPAVA